ncbi:MAG: dihydrofolate reductase [Calditrichaeota bacterium]|nr:dihydrofolate reductase [Calditrichota bacterium]MBT7619343.1 dihydrofolate reductase [Calditrichota bacterium]
MPNHIYIATSLDGFIATTDGGIDWLNDIPNPDGSDYGYTNFMQKMDALVMGRKTFQVVLGFGEWPYDKPVFVLSNSLTSIPDNLKDKVKIVSGDLKSVISDLNKQGYQNLYIDGGKVIQSFLCEDLIDEMTITRIPILLGSGIPLFGELKQRLKFTNKNTQAFGNGLVMSSYVRDRG